MKLKYLLPNHFIEHDFFYKMFKHFEADVFKNKIVIVSHNYKELPEYGKNVIAILTAGNEKGNPPKYKNKVGLVFKHHLDKNYIDNVYHIPLPYVGGFDGDASIPILERKYDLVFIGRTCKRKDMWEAANLWAKRNPKKNCFLFDSGQKFKGINGGMGIKKYSQYMKQAKIVLSPKGMVRAECLRFSEAVKCGSAIIACPHPKVRVFTNCPAYYIKGWNNLPNVLDSITDEQLEKTHKKMKHCWNTYFSPSAVGKYINKIVKAKL